MSRQYLHIVMVGVPFLTLYNIYAAVVRGNGNSKAPFLCMAGAGIGNVFLDILFVYGLSMGVAGAALATLLTQMISAISLVIYTIKRYEHLRFIHKKKVLHRQVAKEGLELSLPITARSVVSALGSAILQNFMNGFGTLTVAAITTAYRVDCVLLLPAIHFATGISTLVSQSVGEGRPEKGRKILQSGLIMMSIICVIMSIFIFFFGSKMIKIFGVSDEAARIGGAFFKRLGAFYLVFGLANSFSSYLEGVGDVLFTGAISICALLIRIAMSYLLKDLFGNMVIAWAECIAWSFLLVFMGGRYYYRMIYNEKVRTRLS